MAGWQRGQGQRDREGPGQGDRGEWTDPKFIQVSPSWTLSSTRAGWSTQYMLSITLLSRGRAAGAARPPHSRPHSASSARHAGSSSSPAAKDQPWKPDSAARCEAQAVSSRGPMMRQRLLLCSQFAAMCATAASMSTSGASSPTSPGSSTVVVMELFEMRALRAARSTARKESRMVVDLEGA